jgi:hypothetical protein
MPFPVSSTILSEIVVPFIAYVQPHLEFRQQKPKGVTDTLFLSRPLQIASILPAALFVEY